MGVALKPDWEEYNLAEYNFLLAWGPARAGTMAGVKEGAVVEA